MPIQTLFLHTVQMIKKMCRFPSILKKTKYQPYRKRFISPLHVSRQKKTESLIRLHTFTDLFVVNECAIAASVIDFQCSIWILSDDELKPTELMEGFFW